MKLLTTLAVATLTALSVPAFAQQAGPLELVYDEDVGGGYNQNWSAQVLGNHQETGVKVYVVGVGKRGDFFGVISVDCETPGYSRWLATGGFVPSENLPDQVVQGFRRLACGS